MSAHTANRCDCVGFYVSCPNFAWVPCAGGTTISANVDGEFFAVNSTPGIADDLQALMLCTDVPNSGAVVIADIPGCPSARRC